jgi:hypothetical protein
MELLLEGQTELAHRLSDMLEQMRVSGAADLPAIYRGRPRFTDD